MRYVLVGPAYPLRGGIARFNGRLYCLLRESGHTVLALNFRRQYPGLLFPGRTQEETGPDSEGVVEAYRVLDSVNPLSWVRTARMAALFRPDAAVFHHWMPFFAPCYGAVSALLRAWSHARIVWICHNLTPHERQPAGSWLNRLGLSAAHAFVVMSESVESDLLRLRPNAQYRRLLHPTDQPAEIPDRAEARRRLNLPGDVPVLLFFGYVRRYKGLDLLLAALARVLAHENVFLLVAGEFYEPLSDYVRLVRELGIQDAVELRDLFVPNDEIPWYFAACDAVVLPYRSATQSGIVPLAYAYRRPVVTTAVGGLPEVVRDGRTGVLAPEVNADSVAEAILRFLELTKQVDWSVEIEEFRKLMSWDRFVDALEELVGGKG